MLWWILVLFHSYGWKVIVSIFWPVYWEQDIYFRNNGNDIITFRPTPRSWYYGTLRNYLAK